jgi:hypothetical protein
MADEIDKTEETVTPEVAASKEPSGDDILAALLSDPEAQLATPAPKVAPETQDASEVKQDGPAAKVEGEVERKTDEAATGGAAEAGEGGIPGDPASAGHAKEGEAADAGEAGANAGGTESGAAVEPTVESQPSPRELQEQRIAAAEHALADRAAKYDREQQEYDAKIAAKKKLGEDEDPIDDYPVAMKLLREANAIERARNDLLEARQVVHEQAVQEERYWERTYVSDFPAITPEEGRKMFSEEMKKAYAKYVGQDHGNKIKVAMAHAAGSELFEHRSKTVQGQRAARAVKTKVDDKKKPPVVPKTPITPGGGRVLPPPTAGSASTRVEQPKPKTNEEGLAELGAKAGKSPIDVLLS